MIEQFLQTALEFVKEIWFQLDSRFDLENTEAFKFLKPYLIQLQDNPLYMGISVAALFLAPYALIKVKSISRERERKLDELMEEMEDEEEEYDEDDPRRLRRSDEPEASAEVDDDSEKPLFGNDDNDDTPSYRDVLDEMEEKADSTDEEFEAEFELEPSPSDNEETTNLEENAEPVSSQLAESDFDKDLNEFMSLDENKEPNNIDDSSHDQAIKELQEDGELMELDDNLSDDPLSDNDPFDNYSELDEDEQDKAIKDLQAEMERTINQLTEQIEDPTEPHSPIKDLSQIHIGGDATIDDDYIHEDDHTDEGEFFLDDETSLDAEKEAPSPQEEPAPVSELSDSEILASLEPELEDVLSHEAEPEYKEEPIAVPKTSDYEPELAGFTFEAESDIPELEPEASAENFTFEAESMSFEETPEPELNTPPSPLGETDSLIDRLKFLQTRFENRYQPSDRSPERPPEPAPSPAPIEKDIADYVNFTEPRRYSSSPTSPPPDSKKYMDLLESFVFMKDQKKHK
jgi:hypothetical protein